ncbi:MAG: signal peptidase II [Armatimonadota bacterium]|nr:signal peptidase II [bacterium]MDW8105151.1 signal peptidase II [Armatimonadota bacterium]MDW8289690.1 signal peptidase II [Armatimonadota bacterium]
MKGWFFAGTLLVILFDQASKWWIQWTLSPGQSVPIVPGVLHFTLSFNSGIAFGLFPQFGRVFLWLSLAIVGVVLVYYLHLPSPSAWTTAIASLLTGGALGNVLDRLRLGHVVDFIDFRVFPVFNLADTAVTCATILWIVRQWYSTSVGSEAEGHGADC